MMTVLDFLKLLDFEEFNYFYHETSYGIGNEIMEEGLMVEGTNILNTKNIAYTTISPLLPEMVKTPRDFVVFLDCEKSSSIAREVSEMVILCCAKEVGDNLVEQYHNYHGDNRYAGIIRRHHIMGVIDMDTLEFVMNEEFEFASDLVDSSDYSI